MPITYPLDFPDAHGVASVRITQRAVVAVSMSPFTGSQQAQRHAGQWFEAEVSLPAMYRDAAATWHAFFLALNGREGTFLMGDPSYLRPRGSITSCSVNGSNLVRQRFLAIRDIDTSNPDLQVNGGFESGDIDWLKETNWSISSAPLEARSGTWCAQRTGNPVGTALRGAQVPCSPGQHFVAQAYIRRDGSSGAGYVRLTVRDAVGAFTTIASGNSVASATYGLSTVIATIPTDAVTVRAELVATNTSGTIYGDDVILRVRPTLLPGDYLQLGSGASSRLHKVITPAVADGNGEAVLDIWPALRASYADGAAVTLDSPRGVWRLASNEMPYEYVPGRIFPAMTFACTEAL